MVYDIVLFGFRAGNITICIKESSEYSGFYQVKVMHVDGAETIIRETASLSSALLATGDKIGQFTGDFTIWKKI